MMKKKLISAIAVMGIIGGTAYGLGQSDALSNQAGASEEEYRGVPESDKHMEQEMNERLGVKPTEEVTPAKVKAAYELWNKRKPDFKDKEVEYTAMGKFLVKDVKYGEKNINIGELKKEAVEEAKFNRAFVKLAKERYGVEVSEEEIDTLIRATFNNGNFESKELEVWSKGLGMTKEEMIQSDRDSLERLLLWENLTPAVAKKHGLERSEFKPSESLEDGLHSFDNKIADIYNKEVREYLNRNQNKY